MAKRPAITSATLTIIMLALLVFGLAALLASTQFKLVVANIHVEDLLARVGEVIVVVVSLHLIFDFFLKQQLVTEIVESTLKQSRLFGSGISDVIDNSLEIDYKAVIATSSRLIVGLNYSARLIDDYYEELRQRSASGKQTVFLFLDSTSLAGEYARSLSDANDHIEGNLRKIRERVTTIAGPKGKNTLMVRHRCVLRYSFVLSDSSIWVKPYRNSKGHARVPALEIKPTSHLFDFFRDDIEALLKEGQSNAVGKS